jgi:hypothetical protein
MGKQRQEGGAEKKRGRGSGGEKEREWRGEREKRGVVGMCTCGNEERGTLVSLYVCVRGWVRMEMKKGEEKGVNGGMEEWRDTPANAVCASFSAT